ncbi:MAG: helix-turn-helix domain-containing protein [Lachnospiraceae bacterium]|nr:helix-turn-helix domain-containing protein [Lachnospiraceae bacterium]
MIAKEKHISVREIQHALGLASNQAIYDWFNGKTLPTLNNFVALSYLFHTSMEDMLVLRSRKRKTSLQNMDSRKTNRANLYLIFFADRDANLYFDYGLVAGTISSDAINISLDGDTDSNTQSQERISMYWAWLSEPYKTCA